MIRKLAPVLALALLAACGHSAETHMLTLDAAPPSAEVAYAGPPLRVTSVDIPPALDRLEFAEALGPTELKLRDQYEWSASLGSLARAALIRDLAARLPAGAVLPPDSPAGKGTRRAQVAILSLTTTPDATRMEAIVTVAVDGGALAQRRQLHLSRQHMPGELPTAAAAEYSSMLGELADQIAAMAASLAGASGR